jgi:hypothetical protein
MTNYQFKDNKGQPLRIGNMYRDTATVGFRTRDLFIVHDLTPSKVEIQFEDSSYANLTGRDAEYRAAHMEPVRKEDAQEKIRSMRARASWLESNMPV